MNAYDFDKTIFKGDSTARFYVYCLMRTPRMLKRLPRLVYEAATLLKKDKQLFKQHMFGFLTELDDPEKMVARFWDKNMKHVKAFYQAQKRPDDVIISASPEFLIKPVMARLGCLNVMASPVDIRTGLYSGLNCHGKEKVRRFYEKYPNAVINEFYSDSHSDDPMAELAQKAVLVKGEKLLEWK